MAGTKQIRFGRIERKIQDMELLLQVYKQGMKLHKNGSFEQGVYFGKIESLELIIMSLKELGAPQEVNEGEIF